MNQAAGYFRTEIGKRMMLRITPQLRFFFDSVEEEAQKVDALLRKAAVISSEMPADAASETDKG